MKRSLNNEIDSGWFHDNPGYYNAALGVAAVPDQRARYDPLVTNHKVTIRIFNLNQNWPNQEYSKWWPSIFDLKLRIFEMTKKRWPSVFPNQPRIWQSILTQPRIFDPDDLSGKAHPWGLDSEFQVTKLHSLIKRDPEPCSKPRRGSESINVTQRHHWNSTHPRDQLL